MDGQGGISITLWSEQDGFKTIYYHLNDVVVEKGDKVVTGQLIGHTGNTGKYTTGPHLHFGLKMTNGQGKTINWKNGYKGAIDPKPFLPKNYSKPPVWSGYGKIKKGWGGRNLKQEFKQKYILTKKLKRLVLYLEIKAVVYGGWTIEDLKNPALRLNWMYTRRDEFIRGVMPTFTTKLSISLS